MKTMLTTIADKQNFCPLSDKYATSMAAVFMLYRFTPNDRTVVDFMAVRSLSKVPLYLRRIDCPVNSLRNYIRGVIDSWNTNKTMILAVYQGCRGIYDCARKVFERFNCPPALFIGSDFIGRPSSLRRDKIKYINDNSTLDEIDLPILRLGKNRVETSRKSAELIAHMINYGSV